MLRMSGEDFLLQFKAQNHATLELAFYLNHDFFVYLSLSPWNSQLPFFILINALVISLSLDGCHTTYLMF